MIKKLLDQPQCFQSTQLFDVKLVEGATGACKI